MLSTYHGVCSEVCNEEPPQGSLPSPRLCLSKLLGKASRNWLLSESKININFTLLLVLMNTGCVLMLASVCVCVCVCVCMCMYVVKCLSWAFLKPDRLSDVKLEYRITIFLSVILSWKQYDNVKQDNWSVNSCKCFLQSQFTGLWMPAVCLSNLLPGLFMISWLWHWIRSKMSSFFPLCEISLA